MTTYRAAYLPPPAGSNGAGFVLTGPEDADLPDDELRLAAAPALAESNAACRAIGAPESSASDIEIGDWTD